MQIGLVGLGKMGANMALRLMRKKHECVVYDINPKNVKNLVSKGAKGAESLADLSAKLCEPKKVWVMVPAGQATKDAIFELAKHLQAKDIIIDGGNTHFKDDLHRGQVLQEKGIFLVDVGTSGGIWGADRGYCLMVGGDKEAVKGCEPVFEALSPGMGEIERTPTRIKKEGSAEKGYLHCGPLGSGHFVKMIHNGIEYGIMQAYAEGFDILRSAGGENVATDMRFDLDLADIAEVWRRGSVVGSWLLDLIAISLSQSPNLDEFSGHVKDSGEGRWTIDTAIENGVSADVLTSALYARFRSQKSHTFAEKVLSAMRFRFGGHVEPSNKKND